MPIRLFNKPLVEESDGGQFTGASAEGAIPDTYSWDDDARFIVELQATDSAGGVRTAERTVRFTRLQAEAADVISGFRSKSASRTEA